MNEIATKLFINPDAGITADRVHALNLTDIKNAAEAMNGSSYNWDESFIGGATTKNETFGELVTTNSKYKKYPKIYGTSTGEVTINDETFSEKIVGDGIPVTNDAGTTASTLKLYDSFYDYYDEKSTMQTNLGTFGTSNIAKELFYESDAYPGSYQFCWLASRVTYAYPGDRIYYNIRCIFDGYLYEQNLAFSDGTSNEAHFPMRAVVSLPWSSVSVANDGTVTLN